MRKREIYILQYRLEDTSCYIKNNIFIILQIFLSPPVHLSFSLSLSLSLSLSIYIYIYIYTYIYIQRERETERSRERFIAR